MSRVCHSLARVMTASGIGSWPGTDVRTAIGAVAEILGGLRPAGPGSGDGVAGLPYVPELPDRGPGADMIGRSASLLAGLHVDLQPSGWRLVDHPGRDSGRADAFWRQDGDELAEAYDGYVGPLKVSFTGPWTLAANVRLARGERVVGDPGAARDVAQSAAEGYGAEFDRLRALVPGATWVVQIDEPSLPSVLAGRLPTSSGYGVHRAVDEEVATRTLKDFVEFVASAAGGEAARERIVMHCCAPDVPLGMLREAGADAVSLDVGLLTQSGWEKVAAHLETGLGFWAGLPVPSAIPVTGKVSGADLVRPVERAWQALGLGAEPVSRLTLTPACGLAGAGSSPQAAAVQRAVVEGAQRLRDVILEV